jgi:hypothetical protein
MPEFSFQECLLDAESLEKVKLSYGITLVEMQQKNIPLNVQQV